MSGYIYRGGISDSLCMGVWGCAAVSGLKRLFVFVLVFRVWRPQVIELGGGCEICTMRA